MRFPPYHPQHNGNIFFAIAGKREKVYNNDNLGRKRDIGEIAEISSIFPFGKGSLCFLKTIRS